MKFLLAKSVTEAVCFFYAHPEYQILAGGTDLCVQLHAGAIKPAGLICIRGIKELGKILDKKTHVFVGSLATHTQISSALLIKKHVPVLAKACLTVGARQIQNQGTIGGNVMNASPAGDTLPVLMALGADVEVQGPKGIRRIPFGAFFTGYRKTAVAPGELVTGFWIPKKQRGEVADFLKVGTRKAQAISKVMGCFQVRLFKGGILHFAGAMGSVAAVPVRLCQTEAFLIGKKLGKTVIAEAIAKTCAEVAPIDDVRSTAGYRRHVAGVLVKRFLEGCLKHGLVL